MLIWATALEFVVFLFVSSFTGIVARAVNARSTSQLELPYQPLQPDAVTAMLSDFLDLMNTGGIFFGNA